MTMRAHSLQTLKSPITHILMAPQIGGAERDATRLYQQLRLRGYPQHVLLDRHAHLEDRLFSGAVAREAICGLHLLSTPFRVARRLRQSGSRLVHLHDAAFAPACCLGAHLAGVPTIATVRTFSGRWSVLFPNHLVAASQAIADHLLAQGCRTEKLTVVRSGVDTVHFTPGDFLQARRQLGLAEEAYTFLYLGRLARGKGLPQLIDAFAELTQRHFGLRLVIAGTGPLEDACTQQVERMRIAPVVRFLGFQEDVRPVLAAADCLVSPGAQAGVGMALLEAMASGRAVIAADAGGAQELIHDRKTGLLVNTQEAEALRNAMRYALLSRAWTSDAGLAARTHVEAHFTLQQEVDGVEAVYRTVLGK